MTQVLFAFVHPDGSPVVNAGFTVQLRRTGFVPEGAGVVVPKTYTFTTGLDGTALAELQPSTSVYTMVFTQGTEDCGGIRYKFYVPDSDEIVKAQDLFLDPKPNSEPWDETAIRMLTEAKTAAVNAANTAVSASLASQASAAASEASALRAEAIVGDANGDAVRAERARDAAEGFAINTLSVAAKVDTNRILAQQAAIEAGNAAGMKVDQLVAVLATPPGAMLVPGAVAMSADVDQLKDGRNTNDGLVVNSPVGNLNAVAHYIKTGVVDPTKALRKEPPYVYDSLGTEYKEKRGISFQHIPQINLDSSPKLIVKSPFLLDQLLVAVKKNTAGYLLVGLANNITTNSTDSLGMSGDEQTMFRVVSVQSAVSVVVGYKGVPAETGAWAKPSMNSVLPEIPAFTSSSAYTYFQTQIQNAILSYGSVPVEDGKVRVTFLTSPGSNPNASITIDGVVYPLNLVSATAKFRTFTFFSYKESVSVVIKNEATIGGYFINFMGMNFSTLDKWADTAIDSWGYYRNSSQADYIISNSENDYTMKEWTTKIYGGGYHGGEKAITDKVKVDGVSFDVTAVPKLCRKLGIDSECTISWEAVGNASVVKVRKNFNFVSGGYYCSVGFRGKVILSELYAALFGASQAFSEIEAPTPLVIADSAINNGRINLGRTSKVIMLNPVTSQRIVVNYTVHQDDSASQYGGVYVWRVDGTYNKLYYSQAHAGKLAVDGSYTLNNYEFQ